MTLGGGSEAGSEVEAVIEIELHDADAVGSEWDEGSVWLELMFGLDEIDVGVAVAAAVVYAVVKLADVEAGAGMWTESGFGEVGGAGG